MTARAIAIAVLTASAGVSVLAIWLIGPRPADPSADRTKHPNLAMSIMRKLLSLVSLAVLLAATTALSGCGGGDSTSPRAAVATGRWSGTMQGAASLGGTNVPKQLTVTGTYAPPSLSVTMGEGGLHPPANLTGTIDGTMMTAVVNGSGFINDPIVLTRQ